MADETIHARNPSEDPNVASEEEEVVLQGYGVTEEEPEMSVQGEVAAVPPALTQE